MTQYALASGLLDNWTGGSLSIKSVDGATVFPAAVTGLGKLGTGSLTFPDNTGDGVIWDDADDTFNNPIDAESLSVSVPIVITNGNADTAATFRLDLTGELVATITAVDDAFTIYSGGFLSVDVLANDVGDNLSVSAVSAGNVTIGAAPNYLLAYDADGVAAGADSFTYTLSNGATTDQATVNVTVLAAYTVTADSNTEYTTSGSGPTFEVIPTTNYAGTYTIATASLASGPVNASDEDEAQNPGAGDIGARPSLAFTNGTTIGSTVTVDHGLWVGDNGAITIVEDVQTSDDEITWTSRGASFVVTEAVATGDFRLRGKATGTDSAGSRESFTNTIPIPNQLNDLLVDDGSGVMTITAYPSGTRIPTVSNGAGALTITGY